MATGMICVASNVDGIPEILEEEDIYDYSDVLGMANRIRNIINDPKKMNEISQRNYSVSQNYSNEKLSSIYDAYYEKVRKLIDERKKENVL